MIPQTLIQALTPAQRATTCLRDSDNQIIISSNNFSFVDIIMCWINIFFYRAVVWLHGHS